MSMASILETMLMCSMKFRVKQILGLNDMTTKACFAVLQGGAYVKKD